VQHSIGFVVVACDLTSHTLFLLQTLEEVFVKLAYKQEEEEQQEKGRLVTVGHVVR